MDKQEAKTVEEENTQFISTKGETTKNEGYYLKELHGYVAAGSCADRKICGDDERTVWFFGKLLQLEKSIWTKFLK